MLTLLVNTGYGMMLLALLARDILWLRLLLIVGQSTLCVYCMLAGAPNAALWNGVFVAINLLRAAQTLNDKRSVIIPAELADVYQKRFSILRPVEFLALWKLGQRLEQTDGLILKQGDEGSGLYCLIEGHVEIDMDAVDVAHAGPAALLGEMSLLTGDGISADVKVLEPVALQHWDVQTISHLQNKRPVLWQKLQAVIGADMVEKIRRSSQLIKSHSQH